MLIFVSSFPRRLLSRKLRSSPFRAIRSADILRVLVYLATVASVTLALFDLDDTLLNGDSDYLWGEYLADIGVLDAAEHRQRNFEFLQAYKADRLDIYAFLEYQLAPLAAHSVAQLNTWRTEFIDTRIRPLVLPKAIELVEQHRCAGHQLAIVTATNEFITAPIADLFEVSTLIAIQLEMANGRYTGKPFGVPSSGEGKVVRVKEHFGAAQFAAAQTWFYSDSIRDLPLLRAVDHPVAVNASEELLNHATANNWQVMSTHG